MFHKEVQYFLLKNKQANRFLNAIAIILILFSFALGFMGNVIDFKTITAPFETFVKNNQVAQQRENHVKDEVKSGVETAMDITGLSKAQQYYIKFQSYMEALENSIAEFDNYALIVVALLLLYAIKAVISFVPLAATCLVSGLVFPFPVALVINFIGVAIILTIKYFWGKHISEGNFAKLAKKSDAIWELIEDTEKGDGTGNPIILFLLRIVPSVPIGPVSQMYGKMGYNFWHYLFISLLGYSLKITSFTMIGYNAADPFSARFIVPLVVILFISGVGILGMNFIFTRVRKKRMASV